MANRAMLNIVQCSGSMTTLAKEMETLYGIPFIRVSFFGIDDTADALYKIADHFQNPGVLAKTMELVKTEVGRVLERLFPEKGMRGQEGRIICGRCIQGNIACKSPAEAWH